MTNSLRILLDPNPPPASGGASGTSLPASVPSAPAAPAAAPAPTGTGGRIFDTPVASPTPSPAGTGVGPDIATLTKERDSLTAQLAAAQPILAALQRAGVKSVDDLARALPPPRPDPNSIEEIIKGIFAPKPIPGTPPRTTPESPSTAGTTEDVGALVSRAITAYEQKQNERAYEDAARTEASLRAKIVGDKAFNRIMGGLSFEDARAGKGKSKAAKAVAFLADQLLFERGSQNPTGVYRPVTDPSAIGDVVGEISDFLKELKAVAILDAAQEPDGVETPGLLGGRAAQAGDPVKVDLADPRDMLWSARYAKEREKEQEVVASLMKQVFQRELAAQEAAPLSQSL